MSVWDEAKQEKQKQAEREEATELMEKKIRQAAMEAQREQSAAQRKSNHKNRNARELDDDYGDFNQEGEPYTVQTFSAKQLILMLLAALVVLGVAGFFTYGYVQRLQWINQQVDTVAMAQARKNAYLYRLPAKTLQSKQTLPDGSQLYSAIYFPEQETLLATIDVVPDFEQMYCFLVDTAGRAYAGWYNDTVVQYEIAKVAFEKVPTGELVYLDCVDSRTAQNGYDPAAENPTRVRYTLSPLPPPTLSEADTAQSSSEATS